MLDDVAGVDVLVVAIGLALAADDEEHARLAIGIDDGAHGCDVARPLLFDACRQFVETFPLERRTGEAPNVLPKAGAQPIEIEPGHLRRGDDRAVGHGDVLICRGLRSGRQQRDEQSECAHARRTARTEPIAKLFAFNKIAQSPVSAAHTCARASMRPRTALRGYRAARHNGNRQHGHGGTCADRAQENNHRRSSRTVITFGAGSMTASFTELPLLTITKLLTIGNGSPGTHLVETPVQSAFTV